MAQQQSVARKKSRLKRDQDAESGSKQSNGNGNGQEVPKVERELADYLQDRIKPGLNRGAIPLLARSIAREVSHWEAFNGASEAADVDDEPDAEAEDESAEVEDETGAEDADDAGAEAEDEADPEGVFEAEMHDFQAELGEEWILRFSVKGGEAWLTAEKDDGSQHIEAPNAAVLLKAAKLLDERGGRSD